MTFFLLIRFFSLYITDESGCSSNKQLRARRYNGLSSQRFKLNHDFSISPVCSSHLILGILETKPAKAVFVGRRTKTLSKKFTVKTV